MGGDERPLGKPLEYKSEAMQVQSHELILLQSKGFWFPMKIDDNLERFSKTWL